MANLFTTYDIPTVSGQLIPVDRFFYSIPASYTLHRQPWDSRLFMATTTLLKSMAPLSISLPPTFPPEIFELVLRKLRHELDGDSSDEECRSALRNCLFVSVFFHRTARTLLFHTVTITNTPTNPSMPMDQMNRLKALLAPAAVSDRGIPAIHNLVKRLIIRPRASVYEHIRELGHKDTAAALRSLPHIQELVLDFTQPGSCRWTDLGSLTDVLGELVHQPSLTSFSFAGIVGVPWDLLRGSNVRKLTIGYGLVDMVPSSTPTSSPFPQLEWLEIKGRIPPGFVLETDSNKFLEQLSPKAIKIHVGQFFNFMGLRNVLHSTQKSLGHLHLNFERRELPSVSTAVDLGILTSLEHLFLLYDSYSTSPMTRGDLAGNYFDHLSEILEASSNSGAPNALQTMTLFVILPVFIPKTSEYEFDLRAWSVLDRALAKERLSAIQRINLKVMFDIILPKKRAFAIEDFRRNATAALGAIIQSFTMASKVSIELVVERRHTYGAREG